MSAAEIQCPSCWEHFEVMMPPDSERPCAMDYDCEVCCRPLQIVCEPGESCYAQSLDD